MRVVVQRVNKASVSIKDQIVAKITNGLVILLGIEVNDTQQDCLWLARKIASLRIFSDEDGRMNDSILDVDGEVIVVSQFTLHAKIKKGNRPSYIQAAGQEQAVELYERAKKSKSMYFALLTRPRVFKPKERGPKPGGPSIRSR